jgi:glycosyltransferase involved in cell wall biosynthesis
VFPLGDASRRRIAYIAPWVDLGGSDKGTIDWFRHLDSSSWQASLLTTQPSPNRWIDQVVPHAAEVWDLPANFSGAEFPRAILGFIATRDIDVVHIMNSRLAFDLLPDIAGLPRRPAIVVQLHTEEVGGSGYPGYVGRRYADLVDAFSVSSRWLADAMIEKHGVAPERVHVIGTGVDAEHEFNPERVAPMDLPGEGPHILWPGRLVEQKDPVLAVDVVAELHRRGAVSPTLHMVGEGALLEQVRARSDQLGVADAIVNHPASSEMPRWFRSTDAMLMTSRFEGVPYVIYEAMSMGVPVVAPALPGNCEILGDDAGQLVEARSDPGAYASALEGVLGDAAGSGCPRGRERMLTEHGLDRMSRAHEELYTSLLAVRDRGAAAPAAREAPIRLGHARSRAHRVGVIVPCYRHGAFLRDCIASIKAQTLAPAQIVVVDDASPDATTRAALAELDRDPAVEVLRLEENSGPSIARNRAIERLGEVDYVLPLDADDALAPRALERYVEALESSSEQVGFAFPSPQHFGNRNDRWEVPEFNRFLLMHWNYCHHASLFDSRIFAEGVRYPEDIVVGHEDWDLIVQLLARGVEGVRVSGETYRYRKRGFSRVNLTEVGGKPFAVTLPDRHPALYEHGAEVKAQWLPAISIIPLESPGGRAAPIADQTLRDFEVVEPPAGEPGPRLAKAIAEARGRFVYVADPDGMRALGRPETLELLIRLIGLDHGTPAAVVTRTGAGGTPFHQLTAERAESAVPCGVLWRRQPDLPFERPPARWATLGAEPLVDLIGRLQVDGGLIWLEVAA